jgi:peptide/nickel transport system ATP-binding protein
VTRVIDVEHLNTVIRTAEGQDIHPVSDVSFYVEQGEVLGLVGESGSGKSMTAFSLLGLIEPPARITSGRIVLNGVDLCSLPKGAWRALCGDRIAMIFQDPMSSLNPVLKIETQMVEAVLAHQSVSHGAAKRRALEVLAQVGIPDPARRLGAYPHEFSGGMRQRVSIAIALLNRPDLIVCDEPTTALDVSIQGQILAEMQKLCAEYGTALIWITHDLSIVAGLADRVSVMYAGRIVETGTTREVLEAPRHRYTRGLLDSTPAAARLRVADARPRLQQIPGSPPSLKELPCGCPFHPRCAHATDACLKEPEETVEVTGHRYRCIHPSGRDES